MITFLSKWGCKVDDAQDRAMLEGPQIIVNPNHRHCCPFPHGQGPHWGTLPPACELEHIFSVCPNPAACKLYDPKIDLQKKWPRRWSKSGVPGGSRCTRPFCIARGGAISDTHPVCPARACPFPNQGLLWCIWGCNSVSLYADMVAAC